METCRSGSPQTLAVLAGMGQAGADSFPENLPLESAKTASKPAVARPAGVVRSSASVSETQMPQLLEGRQQVGYRSPPTIQSPY